MTSVLLWTPLLLAVMISRTHCESKPCKGNWELIFHAPSGNGESVLETWKRKHTDCDLFTGNCPCSIYNGCLPKNTRLEKYTRQPRKILRSPYIDYWDCYNIQKVRFELNTRGKTVAFIEFNGRGSNYMNWFHNSRILKTSWTDMHKSGRYNFFSMDKETRYARKFFINHSYPSGGCPRDIGWFVVTERKGVKPCSWEKYKAYPQFLYSKRGKMGRWTDKSSLGIAEVLNIYVQRG